MMGIFEHGRHTLGRSVRLAPVVLVAAMVLTPATHALAQGAVKSVHKDWQIRCDTPPGAKTEQCALIQSVTAEDRANVGLTVIVLKTADLKSRLMRVVAPLGVLLPSGLGLKIDNVDIFVMFLSIAIDTWRSRALGRIASKYDSQALEADALHFSTDVWSSSVVILGLAVVEIGRFYRVEWLRQADPIAALFVAGVVVYVSWRLARKTIDALLDAAPAGVRNQILGKIGEVEGVLEVERIRIRRAGNRYFADVSVGLARNFTFQRTEQVAAEVTGRVHEILPDADVMVHSVPRARRSENIFDRIRGVATRNNFNVHDVSVQDLNGQLHVEQHLELDEQLTMKQAHDEVTRLETEIRGEVPEISTILTHIESEPATIETGEQIVREPELERRLKNIVQEFPEVLDVHEFQFKKFRDRLYVSCHCTLPDDMQLSRVHDVQTALEIRFKHHAPELFRVLIHPEPMTDNRR